MKYRGWIVGITYCTKKKSGLNYNHFEKLLDEMEKNNMNLLSLMMLSYGFYDPEHDGYCWPVKNPKLRCYLDENATNSNPETEFISKVIDNAEKKGIEVELFLNWGIWNNSRIIKEYSSSIIQKTKVCTPKHWLHCPDNKDCWQLGLDEVEDLLKFYFHPNVKKFTFERISYGGSSTCFCPDTQAKFSDGMGYSMLNASRSDSISWRIKNIGNYIEEYVNHIKKIRPDIEIGIHSQGKPWWGHDPKKFRSYGITHVEPHTIQFKTSKRMLYKDWKTLSPNNCILHFDARDKALVNYPIWIKTPKIIKKTLNWISNYPGDNVEGVLFFNEHMVSNNNRSVIYDYCRNN